MPRIQVNEKDLSWYYRQRTPGQVTVFMPGIATFGPNVPTLVNANNFMKVFGDRSASAEDISYPMAASFIKAGLDVLFLRIIPQDAAKATAKLTATAAGDAGTITAKWAGSFGNRLSVSARGTGTSITVGVFDEGGTQIENLVYNISDPNSEYWYENVNQTSTYVEYTPVVGATAIPTINVAGVKLGTGTGNTVGTDGTLTKQGVVDAILAQKDTTFQDLIDPLSYTFDVAVNGGYNGNKTPEEGTAPIVATTVTDIDELFLELVSLKGNAIYLVDGTAEWTAEEFYNYTALANGTAQMSGIPKATIIAQQGFNSSYVAAFGPWCSAELVYNGAVRKLPGSYVLLVSWGQSIARGNPVWMAPAGVKRASLGALVHKPVYEVGSATLDLWQNHEVIAPGLNEHKVNPIMRLKQYGYVIYGNSTLLQTRTDGATSMLQSFSTRVLANLIKNHAFDISLTLQFDQIDDDLFAEFKTLMTVFMDQLRYGGALYDYRIVVDRSTLTLDDLNSRTIPVRIMISPNPAVENFIISLEISQAGVTFGDDSDENSAYVENLVTE